MSQPSLKPATPSSASQVKSENIYSAFHSVVRDILSMQYQKICQIGTDILQRPLIQSNILRNVKIIKMSLCVCLSFSLSLSLSV